MSYFNSISICLYLQFDHSGTNKYYMPTAITYTVWGNCQAENANNKNQ